MFNNLRTVVLFFWSSFLIVSGGGVSPVPDPPCWQEQKSILLKYRQDNALHYSYILHIIMKLYSALDLLPVGQIK